MTPATVTVSHTFEAAHRLPFLGGKCTNLHGHSWGVQVTVAGYPDADGILLDFAALKRDLRAWVDSRLDHAVLLGAADPLAEVLPVHGCNVFVFDPHQAGSLSAPTGGLLTGGRPLAWPTVENVAELLRRRVWLQLGLADVRATERYAVQVRVSETPTNAATAGLLPAAPIGADR